MRLLLDTQILLWAIYRSAGLSRRVASLLADEQNILFVSDVSVWEAGLKLAKGKLEYETDMARLRDRITDFDVISLSIRRDHIDLAVQLPHLHGDPFDRLLIAQALVEGLPFVSADSDIQRYSLEVIW